MNIVNRCENETSARRQVVDTPLCIFSHIIWCSVTKNTLRIYAASPEIDFISKFRFHFRRVHPLCADLNRFYYITTGLDQVRFYGEDRSTRVEEQLFVRLDVDKIEPP